MLQQNLLQWLAQNGHLVERPSQTPSGNTGLNSQNVQQSPQILNNQDSLSTSQNGATNLLYEPWIDYYQGVGRITYHTLKELVKYYNEFALDELVPFPGRGRFIGNRNYTNSLQSVLGTQIYWTEDDRNELFGITEYLQSAIYLQSDDNGELCNDAVISATTWLYVHVSIPGKPLNKIGVEKQLDLLYEITTEYGFGVTRIDTKLRDHSKSFTVSDIISIARKGDFSGAREFSTHTRYRFKEQQSNDASVDTEPIECRGDTVYLGTPSSDKRITFYNAKYVHGVDAIDIETRWRNARAKACLTSILFNEDGSKMPTHEAIRVIHRIVTGSINFVYRTDDKNIDRLQMYDFWRQAREASEGILKVSSPTRIVSGYRMVEWISRQVAPTLSMLKKIIGGVKFNEFMSTLIQKGGERLSQQQYAYINLCMQSKEDLLKAMSANNLISADI